MRIRIITNTLPRAFENEVNMEMQRIEGEGGTVLEVQAYGTGQRYEAIIRYQEAAK
jgi:hypothetical protein